ncbi:SpoIIE family protein phosphatase [Streptomyces sp. NPDC056708]|uniref:SpoIIE family protein phosphatase n=1 Tax=unclassified Streptomyces TaxID=2593676 RepID=UPI0036737414
MSISDRDSRGDRLPDAPEQAENPELTGLMYSAVHDAVCALAVEAAAVYLLKGDDDGHAAMIGGTSPTVFAVPECYTGPMRENLEYGAVFDIPVSPGDHTGPEFWPFSWRVTAAPLSSQGRRFGMFTVMRLASQKKIKSDHAERVWLGSRAMRLARDLSQLAERGIPVVPDVRPSLVPLYGKSLATQPSVSAWGIQKIPGSTGMTFTYQLRNLAHSLNRAITVDDVVTQAYEHLAVVFRGQAVMLSTENDGRTWVSGHRGLPSEFIKRVHGSSLKDNTPLAAVLRGHAMFFHDRSQLFMAYPEAPDDGYHAWALLPLRGGGKTVGACCLSFDNSRRFTDAEKTVLMLMADQLGSALERVFICEKQHALAESVQRSLLPRTLPALPSVVVSARYLPAAPESGVGGDWYDVMDLGTGKTGVVVGDVEGHDVRSSIVMGQVRSAILAYAAESHDPAAILDRMNSLLSRLDIDRMVTCCVAFLDPSDGTVEIALAGHPKPLIRGPDGLVTVLEADTGPPLGCEPTTGYRSYETRIRPDSLLFLFTDGLWDGQSPDVMTTAHALFTSASSGGGNRCPEVVADLLARQLPAVRKHSDDVVLLLAWYSGPGPDAVRVRRTAIRRHDLRGVGEARRFTRSTLREWNLQALSDITELLVTEVVTNGLVHADSDVDMRLSLYGGRLRVEVRDSDPHPPVPSAISVSPEEMARAEHGRGMVIVGELASAWGTAPNGLGKTVWMELET